MYSLEEIKSLLYLIGAAVIGRMLFYRKVCIKGSLKERVKIRLFKWLWEIPVILAIAISSFEMVLYFELRPQAGLVFAIMFGFIGLETLRIRFDDYLDSKLPVKNLHRRESDDDKV